MMLSETERQAIEAALQFASKAYGKCHAFALACDELVPRFARRGAVSMASVNQPELNIVLAALRITSNHYMRRAGEAKAFEKIRMLTFAHNFGDLSNRLDARLSRLPVSATKH